MERGLAIVCVVVLASSTLASPVTPATATSASASASAAPKPSAQEPAAQKPTAQAPGKKTANGQKPAPKAKPEKSSLELALDLLTKIDDLAGAEDPGSTEVERRKLLDEADGRCDKADAAAKTKEERADALLVRVKLARRAFDLEDWAVGVALYTDIVKYVGDPATEWGPGDPFTLTMRGGLYKCLAGSERYKPFAERVYKPVIQMQRELADAWDAKLKQLLATPGEGPLQELDHTVDAHAALGITLKDSGDRAGARDQYALAFEDLRTNAARVSDPEILYSTCADQWELLEPTEMRRITQETHDLVEKHFQDRSDLEILLRTELALQWTEQGGGTENGAKRARAILEERATIEKIPLDRRATLLRECGVILRSASYLDEAERALREALDCIRESRMLSTNLEAGIITDQLARVLVDSGRSEDALRLADEFLERDSKSAWIAVLRSIVLRSTGDRQGALKEMRMALEIGEKDPTQPRIGAPEENLALQYVCRLQIADMTAEAGHVSQALASLEELRAAVAQHPARATDAASVASELSNIHLAAGDVRGATRFMEEACGGLSKATGSFEFQLANWKSFLGQCEFLLGHFDADEQLQRAVRESLTKLGRGEHPFYASATVTLAEVLAAKGKWNDASKLIDEALQVLAKTALPDPFVLGQALAVQGVIAFGMGKPDRAAELLQNGLAKLEGSPGAWWNQPLISYYRARLLSVLGAIGDAEPVHDELVSMEQEAVRGLEPLPLLAAHERGEIVAGLTRRAEQAAALRAAHPKLVDDKMLFEWLTNLRIAGGPLEVEILRSDDSALEHLRAEALRTRRRVAALSVESVRMTDSPSIGSGPPSPKVLAQAQDEQAAAERAFLGKLPPGSRFAWMTTDRIANLLKARDALGISIHRIRASPPEQMEDRFLAFTLDGHAGLRTIDLGPAPVIEEKIRAWREAAAPERGRPVPTGGPTVWTIGAELRAAVLDKLLAGAKEKRIFLCLDDALHSVPWDAMPAAPEPVSAKEGETPAGKVAPPDGKGVAGVAPSAASTSRGTSKGPGPSDLVGDHYHIAELPSLRDLLDATKRGPRQPMLVIFGDISYSAPGAAAKDAPPADRPMRGSTETFARFQPLLFSKEEVVGIANSFVETQKRAPQVRSGKEATKKELFELAKDATCLHISTHGYFASSGIESSGDSDRAALLDALAESAPLSLCGLALAGANADVGARDEVVGIVTAEELAGLDLSACQLAVLSGCETSLGVRRAGQDLASLKSALHAAGARNVIASLWGVPDEQTSQLMRRFYEYLWKENLPPDEALWKAKCSLRNLPLQAWAGWVFSGVPDAK